MSELNDFIDRIEIASPCPMTWERMDGDQRKRLCQACNLNVYNISEMKTDEAIDLLIESEGRLCLRIFRRKDGTVITKDCPVGIERARRALRRSVALIVGFVASVGLAPASLSQTANNISDSPSGVRSKPCPAVKFRQPDIVDAYRNGVVTGQAPAFDGESKQQLEALKRQKEIEEKEKLILSWAAIASVLSLAGVLFAASRKRSSFIFIGGLSVFVFAIVGACLGIGLF